MDAKPTTKWAETKVIAVARFRTKAIRRDGTRKVAQMLERLTEESGWTEKELIDALVRSTLSPS